MELGDKRLAAGGARVSPLRPPYDAEQETALLVARREQLAEELRELNVILAGRVTMPICPECEQLRTLLHDCEGERAALANRIIAMFPGERGNHADAERRLAQMLRADLLVRVRQATGKEVPG